MGVLLVRMGTWRQSTTQQLTIVIDSHMDTRRTKLSAAYLEKLNEGQRAARRHSTSRE